MQRVRLRCYARSNPREKRRARQTLFLVRLELDETEEGDTDGGAWLTVKTGLLFRTSRGCPI
jgi:hypothetical protein